MSGLGSLVVTLAVNTASYAAGLTAAAATTDKQMKAITDSAERAGKVIGLMAATGLTTAAVLVKMAINSADAMGKMAQSAGINIETLSELNYAAGLAGVSTEALSLSVRGLNKSIVDAASGTGESARAFQALGINVKNTDGSLKDADQVLMAMSDKFKGFADGAAKSDLAMQLLRKGGEALIPMLNMGSQEISRLKDEAKALGATMSEETAQAAEKFNDNLSRLNQVKKGLANTIMVAVLPALNTFTDDMIEAAVKTDTLKVAAEAAANGMRLFLSFIVGLGAAVRIAGDSIGKLAAALALVAQGKFSEAMRVMKDDSHGMASVMESAANSISRLWTAAGDAVVITAERVKKAQAPVITSAAQLAEARRLAAEAEKESLFIAKQWEEQMDNEVRVMSEAAHWTSFYRNLQLDTEKNVYVERIKAMSEFYDREQELAIEQAAILAEGPSHTFKLEALRTSLLTQEELEREAHAKKLERLDEFSAEELEAMGGMGSIIVQYEQDHQRRLVQIRSQGLTTLNEFTKAGWQQQAKTIFGQMANITAGVAQHNRALFEINKVAGIANALINAYQGISLTMATYPYPINIAMAALHGVAAFAQVSAISSQSFGGGGSAPSIAGSTAAPPMTPVQSGAPGVSGEQVTVVQIVGETGSMFSDRQVRDLLDKIADGTRDGGRVLVSG